MNLPAAIISQYQAALDMLKQAITKCPESIWDDPADKNKFWHVAYHALFFTHLYLQNSEQDFVAWSKHRNEYQHLGPVPWPPHNLPHIGEPFDKNTVLEYVDFCQQQVVDRVTQLDWEAGSGFEWLPFDKLTLQVYNIRHLQQHTGELMERLGARAKIDGDWVGIGNG
ncbi:MAG TPA: DinB family protein [Aggregatilineaceae bacterium]|nr:DinB family protein [Aggregatilineaceae bacterium]